MPENKFLRELEGVECEEGDQAIFECQMGDDEAEAEWRIAGKVVTEDDRYKDR